MEPGTVAVTIVASIMGGVLGFIKMMENKNAVIDCGCCKLDMRTPETRQKELELSIKNNNCANNNKTNIQ